MMNQKLRSRLLLTAGGAIMASMVPGAAIAQVFGGTSVTDLGPLFTSTVIGSVVVGNGLPQANTGSVTANMNGSTAVNTINGPVLQSIVDSSDNSFGSNAFGNRNGVTFDLSTLSGFTFTLLVPEPITTVTADSIAIATVSTNTGAINSNTLGNVVGVNINGSFPDPLDPGVLGTAVTVAGNSLSATTTINDGSAVTGGPATSILISGETPVGYASLVNTQAQVTLLELEGNDANTSTVAGAVAVSNIQLSSGANSSARVGELVVPGVDPIPDIITPNQIFANLLSDLDSSVTNVSVEVDSNNINADFIGNTRTVSIDLGAATGTYLGTIAVGNLQQFAGNIVDIEASLDGLAALNDASEITATIGGSDIEATPINRFVSSSLSLSSNGITSSATGNVLASTITLADALTLTPDTTGSGGAIVDPVVPISATADIVVSSVQNNTGGAAGTSLAALTRDAAIEARVQWSEGSTVAVDENSISAGAVGSSLSSTLASGENSPVFAGTAALLNTQINGFDLLTTTRTFQVFSVSAVVDNPIIALQIGNGDSGGVLPSSVVNTAASVSDNDIEARATGSASVQSVSLAATSLLGNGGIGSQVTGREQEAPTLDVEADVSITNYQLNVQTPVTALVDGAGIGISAGVGLAEEGLANSQLTVASNAMQAVAQGAATSNSLSLEATGLDMTAAVTNAQAMGIGSAVDATATGSNFILVSGDVGSFDVEALDDVAASRLTVTGNSLDALATGLTASNLLSVDATTLTLSGNPDSEAVLPDLTIDPTLLSDYTNLASFGLVNDQTVVSDVSAQSVGLQFGAAGVLIQGSIVGGSAINTLNRVRAEAAGAAAVNQVNLTANDVDTDVPVAGTAETRAASLANVQVIDADVTALAGADAPATIYTSVAGDVLGSALTTSQNSITAIATGLAATNIVDATANSLAASGAGEASVTTLLTITPQAYEVAAAFSLLSSQVAIDGEVTATLGIDTGEGALAANVLTEVGGDVTASTINSNNNSFAALASSNRAGNLVELGTAGATTTLSTNAGLLNGQTTAQQVTAEALSGAAVLVDADITGSTIQVNGNLLVAQALGNTAGNTMTVNANSLSGTGSDAAAGIEPINEDAAAGGLADFVVANSQFAFGPDPVAEPTIASVLGSIVGASIEGTFAIDQSFDQAIVSSTLSVSRNSQAAEAMVNNATNRLAINGTDFGDSESYVSGAVSNLQFSEALVGASSVMDVFANASSTSSTIRLDENRNDTLAVVNNAANSLVATGTNIAGLGEVGIGGTIDGVGSSVAGATFALSNVQASGGALNASAVTSIYNHELDGPEGTTGALLGSAVSLTGNMTMAEASANRASNTAVVDAGASNAASLAVVNSQQSSTAVASTATSNVQFALTGPNLVDPSTTVDASTASIANNATEALARGNTAENRLTYGAGAVYVNTGEAPAVINAAPGLTQGTAALVNQQQNTGSVVASATANYTMVLNANGAGDTAVANSSVAVNGNVTSATAMGNQAVNLVTLAVLNTGNVPVAVNNIQFNSGNVTATTASVNYSTTVTGPATASVFRTNGNGATATAVGNSVVTSIIGR